MVWAWACRLGEHRTVGVGVIACHRAVLCSGVAVSALSLAACRPWVMPKFWPARVATQRSRCSVPSIVPKGVPLVFSPVLPQPASRLAVVLPCGLADNTRV